MIFQRRAGFTLIELMVTLAVLGILAAIAAPSFSDILERRKLNGAGETLFANLMFAKTEAIKRNADIRVTFVGTGATWCFGLSENVACDCSDNVPACTIDGVTKIVNQGDHSSISVDAAASTFDDTFTTFTSLRGAANTAGKLVFSIANGADVGVVVSTLGRVRLCSNTGSFGHGVCP